MGDEYIKKEDAVKAVANAYWHGTDCECYAFAHKALDNLPTSYVVPREEYEELERHFVNWEPVIRCKDCKHWYNDGDAITWCNLSKWACGGNGFCLYAERKDDECMERNDDARTSNEYE